MKSVIVERLNLENAKVRRAEGAFRRKFEKLRMHEGVHIAYGTTSWFESDDGSFWLLRGEKYFGVGMEEILSVLIGC